MAMHTMDASCSCLLLLLVCFLLLLPVTYSASTPCNATGWICYVNGYYNLTTLGRSNGSRPVDYPIAQVNASWVNRDADGGGGNRRFRYDDGSIVRPLLLRGASGPSFACGFFCRDSCNATLFSIFLVDTNGSSAIRNRSSGFPQVVWSANRDNHVGEGARLQLAPDGRLVLSDHGGAEVWSAGKNVSGMILTEAGNLVLYNSTGDTVWQSFDHATDTVLQGQPAAGQRLVSNVSNQTQDKFFIDVRHDSFDAFIATVDNATNMYYSEHGKIQGGILFPSSDNQQDTARSTVITITAARQFLRLDSDGHLRHYEWSSENSSWNAGTDRLLVGMFGDQCMYPTVCGNYGICSDGQCSCPEDSNHFRPVDRRKPNHGCSLSPPLSCDRSRGIHSLIRLENILYSGYVGPADLPGTDVQRCKEACLRNCSCKAAFFKPHGADSLKGDCFLPSHIFSLIENQEAVTGVYKSLAFLKVQRTGKRSWVLESVLGSVLFALFLLCLLVAGRSVLRRRRQAKDELEGCELPHLPGMPARFSYKELKSATRNFSRLLGEGGFSSVYYGTLPDGVSVAVKLLGLKCHGMKEFLAEVETIGSIHHVNLVRLVGYCAHKLHRLLDRLRIHVQRLPGQVAKGLAYLHEDCRRRIAHLDIKPENILLDEAFNAKVSDFGLSKLIDRDQSQVLTTMRGTPGYLAPEWLTSMITEKVDVYSFGIVVLEMVCGRRNFDVGSRPKPNSTLVKEAISAAQEDRLLEIVDGKCGGVEFYTDEAVKTLRMALWCLQGDPDKRPPMSVVVKALEGVVNIEPFPDCNFSRPPAQATDYTQIYSGGS
ncbi:hypothetical protein Taro_039371, partial [Colocasia esculenta]|nr:hypothetical protein [Colocasia esculenta]